MQTRCSSTRSRWEVGPWTRRPHQLLMFRTALSFERRRRSLNGIFLVLCPQRDEHELARLDRAGHTILRHQDASLGLEEIAGAGASIRPAHFTETREDLEIAQARWRNMVDFFRPCPRQVSSASFRAFLALAGPRRRVLRRGSFGSLAVGKGGLFPFRAPAATSSSAD